MPLQNQNMQLPPQAQQDVIEYYMANSERPIGLLFLAQQAAMGRDAERFEHFAELIAGADANNPEIFRQLAILYSMSGDSDGARRRLNQALKLDGENVMALYSLALLEAEANKYQEAEQLLLKVTKAEPRFERAWYNLALLQHQQGRTDTAKATTAQGQKANPDSASLQEIADFLKQF